MELKHYLTLSQSLQALKTYRSAARSLFYAQNLATHLAYDELGVHTQGFRADRKIIDFLESLALIDERITRHSLRCQYFSEFWQSLTAKEQTQIYEYVYDNQPIAYELLDRVQDEIFEIETALNFRLGIEPEHQRVKMTEDVNENIERLCDFFAI